MSDSNYTPHIGPLVPHPKVEMRVTSGALERAHECDKARDAELAALRQSVSDAYHREQGVQIQNDALRAEVERLREALDDFHDAVCDACESCDPHPPTKPWATETQAIDACMRAAVAAGDALRLNAAKEEA